MDNKTAVQWLEKELQSKLIKIVLENDYTLIDSLFQQALQKERKQIEKAYNQGYREAEIDNGADTRDDISDYQNASNYYNQTYQNNQ